MIEFEVLSSGSRGNAALLHLRGSDRHVLVDAGISPRRTRQAMEARGRSHHELTDVLLTHGDSDHLHAGWKNASVAWGFTIHTHQTHLRRILGAGVPESCVQTFECDFELGDGTNVAVTMAPHDTHGTVAFAVRHGGVTLGWATDLGRANPSLVSFFQHHQLDAIAIESNYDHDMQVSSNRPPFLIDRIIGGAGHLSNEQSIEAVMEIAEGTDLQQVVLLHRSEQCNCPRRITELWSGRAPHLADRVVIASQRESTGVLSVQGVTPASH